MRIFIYGLLVLALLTLIPLAAAQENEAEQGDYEELFIEEESYLTLLDVIGEYGCPVGIRDANRELEINSDGTIVAGQTLLIPIDSPLCEIDYTGNIEFFDLQAYDELRQTSQSYYPAYILANEFAAEHNVCEEALWELNPEWVELWENWAWPSFTYNYTGMYPLVVRIPLDSPECFETVEMGANQHPRDLAEELNICEHIVWYYNPESIYQPSPTPRQIFIPLERQPCLVDGEMLLHEDRIEYGDYVPVEVVRLESAMHIYEFAQQEGYCYRDLTRYNHQANLAPLRAGDAVYIAEDVRACDYVTEVGKSIVDISFDYNVCIEILSEINGFSSWLVFEDTTRAIQVPLDAPPCYDETGSRFGYNDRVIHRTSPEDWLYGIARHYQVCMSDLIESNPLLENSVLTHLPSVIFIPETEPCSDVQADGFIHHIIRPAETVEINIYGETFRNYQNISYVYNVCLWDLVQANPALILEESTQFRLSWYWAGSESGEYHAYDLRAPQVGDEILIPANQRPCYDFYIPMRGIGMYKGISSAMYQLEIKYLCYAEEIDLSRDYTGHEPAISPVPESDEAHCYDMRANPYVVLENERYMLYPLIGDAFLFELAECFGVNAYEIIQVSDEDLAHNGNHFSLYWGIPNPTRDCPLVGNDDEAASNWKRNFYQSTAFGQLNEEGEYAVTYGDTLSSIGRRYGYLPEWIMAENNMPDDTIYIYQTLRLPGYPNLYQLATVGAVIGGGLMLFLGGSFALKLRARRRKGKRKNDE